MVIDGKDSTIKGGSRRAKKSRKVLMMIKAAKLGWAGPAGQEQGWSKARAGLKHEQGRNGAGAELRRVNQSLAERGQEPGRNWGGATR